MSPHVSLPRRYEPAAMQMTPGSSFCHNERKLGQCETPLHALADPAILPLLPLARLPPSL